MRVRIIKHTNTDVSNNQTLNKQTLNKQTLNTISEPSNSRNYITCKALFGLGVTSVVDFINLCYKYKAIKDSGVHYYTANSSGFNKKVKVHLFDSLTEFFRFNKYLTKDHVVVISDVVTILKEIDYLIPLDYDQHRSFEFNFKQPDASLVAKSLKTKSFVNSKIRTIDNLGYHVDRVKNTAPFIASFIALVSNLPFDSRTILRKSICKFFLNKKLNPSLVIDSVNTFKKDFNLVDESDKFISIFKTENIKYYNAIKFMLSNPKIVPPSAAKKFGVDTYTLAYFRKMLRSMEVVNHRNSKSNVEILG